MAKDIVTKAEILGGEIDVRANFGQTVKVTVSPDPYMGDTEVTPSDQTQVLATKKKFVQDDITINPAPTETLSTTSNGTFTPSDGHVGFSQVDVNVVPDLRPLSVSENGSYEPDGFDGYSSVTADIEPNLTSLAVTENGLYLPESGVDGFDRVSVDVPAPAPVTESLSVTENGTYVPPTGVDGFDEVVVDVPTGGFPSYDDVVLPSEYQRVEYIESSGTQFINLPYGFEPADTIAMRTTLDTSMGQDKFMVCPTRWNDNNNRFGLCGICGYQNFLGVAFGSLSTADTFLYKQQGNDGLLHDYYYSDRLFTKKDVAGAFGVGDTTFGAETYPLRLFYGYNANTIGKISYFVHTKADNRKIALFACYRKSDGVIGMYDVENDVFYTNDGTGDFTKGQDI